jgi:hypothetical protein
MRQRALPKPTPKGCPECGAKETRGTVLHRPTCSRKPTVSDGRPHPLAPEIAGAVAVGEAELLAGGCSAGPPPLAVSRRSTPPLRLWDERRRDGVTPPTGFSAIWLYCMIDHGKGSLPSGPCPECVKAYAVSGPPDGKWNSTMAAAGRKGGQSRASRLSPEQRSESARKAAKARWGKADA